MLFHSLYIYSAADFISHSVEALTTEDINAITCLVGETATKFMQQDLLQQDPLQQDPLQQDPLQQDPLQQDPLQPLQLYYRGVTLDTASNRTTTEIKSRRVARVTSASPDALGQQ